MLAAPARADEVYLTEADAPAAVFPEADRFERREVAATPELRERAQARLGELKPSIWEPSYPIASAFRGGERLGEAIVVEEIGKHRPITFVVGVDPHGQVAGVAVMAYREAYGGEVRSRRFLAQYRGKSASDPLLPSRDVRNITGATLSARAIGRGVKKAIAVLQEIHAMELPARRSPPPQGKRERGSPAAGAVAVREAHYVMGTLLEIAVEAPSVEVGRAWIRSGVAEARRLDAELSSFDSQSALCDLNRRAGGGLRRVPRDLFEAVSVSRELSRRTEGAFDVSVGPLVELWKKAARRNEWPSSDEVRSARARVGYEKILLQLPDAVELESPGMSLDLSGIGKGFAADRIARVLRGSGAVAALVNFGESSIVALGPPEGEPPWSIWVRRGSSLEGPLALRDTAVSTSGTFGEELHVSGRRIGHIIDPRSGEPLREDRQATVVAPSGAEAEGWSKAFVLDPDRAFREIEGRDGVAALVFTEGEERVGERFAALTGWRGGSR